jgi:phosphoribosylamine--glycine ligase
MRILILSKEGDGCGLAYRLDQEGHTVDLWIKNKEYDNALVGYVNRPDSWRPWVAKADLIICDMVGFSQYADVFQRYGKPVLCCNQIGDVLELDRERGMKAFEKLGIGIPETFYFNSPQEAKSLEWLSNTGYVIKPLGNTDVGKTYIIPNEELYDWALGTYDKSQRLIVQTRIEDAVEVSTEGWFNGREWVEPFNHTFEEKYHMEGNVGKMTGCMGNVVLPLTKANKLVRETVMKFEPILRKASYKGPIDINCLVQKDRLYALELTCRFGFDAFEALMVGMTEPVGSMLFELATGIKKKIDMRYDFLIAVRVCRDPYPVGYCSMLGKDNDKGMPITGLSEKDMPFVFLSDVYTDNGTMRFAASDGIILKAAAFGRSVKEARHRVYRVVSNVKAIDIQYRTDIGSRVDEDLAKLRSWGWL